MLNSAAQVKDEWIRYKHFWLNNYYSNQLTAKMPLKAAKALFDYPWVFDFLKGNGYYRSLADGRTGRHLEASSAAFSATTKALTENLIATFSDPERTVLIENMVPPEICWAMGLNTFIVEVAARILSMMDQHAVHNYLDIAENSGLPTDSCGLNRATMGTILAEDLPPGKVIVSSNLPCDGGMCSYAKLEEMTGLPIYRLDVPYNFKDDAAMDVYVEDMKGLIDFLEANTVGRMDWDKLKEICEGYNEMIEIERETFEMLRNDPAPILGDSIWQPHYYFVNQNPGTETALKLFQKIHDLARANVDEGIPACPDMRHRCLMWNPPTNCYPAIWNWLERAWGVGVLMDMESFGYSEFVDTTSKESMLRTLAKRYMWATMARHSRGPAENFFEDMWTAYEQFDCDMILFPAHIGCKSSMGMIGLLREQCRDRGVNLCVFDYELMDTRVCSRQGIRDQINQFMKNVMKDEPLDPELLVFDDATGW